MRIVIVHKHSNYTGVSSFVYTVAKHLCREMGHEVYVIIPDQSNKRYCQMLKTAVKGNLRTTWSGPADVFIFNYASDAYDYRGWAGKKVFVVHGLMEQEYVPPVGYVDSVICMSKRAYETVKAPNKLLINQPIDLDRFNCRKPINEELQKVLILDSRNATYYTAKVQAACAELGIYCQTVGKNTFADNRRFDVESVINTCDLVIGYGRSVYEAMACGRPVIVYGINGGDGYITADNFQINYESNCSGWGERKLDFPQLVKIPSIVEQLKMYQASHGQHNRIMAKAFDVRHNIQPIIA